MPNSPSPPSGTTCRNGAISNVTSSGWAHERIRLRELLQITVVRRYARPRDQAAGRCLRRGQKNSTDSAFCRSENVGKSCDFNNLQRLGPPARVDAGGGQGRGRAGRRSRRANGASALARVLRRCVNMLRTIRSKSAGSSSSNGGGRKVEPDERRAHIRRRPERAGRDRQQPA